MAYIADMIGDWVTSVRWEDILRGCDLPGKAVFNIIGVAFAGSERSGVTLTRKATHIAVCIESMHPRW